MNMSKDDKLTLAISEVENGFFYAVYTGDGSKPGSLRSAELKSTLSSAIFKGESEFHRERIIRDCDHEWESSKRMNKCSKCSTLRMTAEGEIYFEEETK